jgi:hypothetical protein
MSWIQGHNLETGRISHYTVHKYEFPSFMSSIYFMYHTLEMEFLLFDDVFLTFDAV